MDDEATAAAAAAAGDENEAAGASRAEDGEPDQGGAETVSYTHLTLPTILLV